VAHCCHHVASSAGEIRDREVGARNLQALAHGDEGGAGSTEPCLRLVPSAAGLRDLAEGALRKAHGVPR
jgi:hypothetical protein